MEWVRALQHSAYRRGYYLAMYSGVRALVNRTRSRPFALDARLAGLHGSHVACDETGDFELHVHARARPRGAAAGGDHGLFSLRQLDPEVGRFAYQFFCSTSHFGCGHVEIAFFERDGVVTFYGVRNIARANARRLGLSRLSSRFRLFATEEEARTLRLFAGLLEETGFHVGHAPAQDCVALTVDERLLPRGRGAEVRAVLRKKYERLRGRLQGAATPPTAKGRAASGARRA